MFCTPGSSSDLCKNRMPDGFITAASLEKAYDGSWIQVLCRCPSCELIVWALARSPFSLGHWLHRLE